MQANRGTAGKLLSAIMAGMLFLIILLFGAIRQAQAKGPLSVTISGPGLPEPVNLMTGDNPVLVSRLMEETGLWYATGNLPRPIAAPQGDLGPAYTLTWVNSGPPHKSEAERTFYQLLYPYAAAGLVIHTPQQETLDGWGQDRLGWFVAPDGLDTLAQLGAPLPEIAPDVRSVDLDRLPFLGAAFVIFLILFARRKLVVMQPRLNQT